MMDSMMIEPRALADQWMKGEHQKPTQQEHRDFNVWLLREKQRMLDANIHPVFVTREVKLTEAIACLNRVTLLDEIKWFPVSRLHNFPNTDLMSLTQNLWFRAIHDLTHWRLGADDTFEGELRVSLAHMESAPDSIKWLIWSEVAGQAAVSVCEGAFPDQKLVKLI